jgi:hypothetical protein
VSAGPVADDALLAHEPLHPLVVDGLAASSQLDGDAWGGTVASGPKVPSAGSKVEPLPVQTAVRSAQNNQSWHHRWR